MSFETKEAEKISFYREEIRKIKEKSGIPGEVTLLAATKTVDAERINKAIEESGLRDIGENRVQELVAKYDALHKEGINIHFIGSLQTNKVKYIIDKVCMIQSLDGISLAKEIDRQAKKHGIVMDVLIEINSGREENKGGIMPEEIDSFIDGISSFENICVKGLMTIAPKCTTSEERRRYYSETYTLIERLRKEKPHGMEFPILSMGMTGSYEDAILCGSTMVRIGSGIFGERFYPTSSN